MMRETSHTSDFTIAPSCEYMSLFDYGVLPCLTIQCVYSYGYSYCRTPVAMVLNRFYLISHEIGHFGRMFPVIIYIKCFYCESLLEYDCS